MSYEHRFLGTRRLRHDPYQRGIFIHRVGPSSFAVTRPLRDENFRALGPDELVIPPRGFPTFQRAVEGVRQFKADHPQFRGCEVYALTDEMPDSDGVIETKLQRL